MTNSPTEFYTLEDFAALHNTNLTTVCEWLEKGLIGACIKLYEVERNTILMGTDRKAAIKNGGWYRLTRDTIPKIMAKQNGKIEFNMFSLEPFQIEPHEDEKYTIFAHSGPGKLETCFDELRISWIESERFIKAKDEERVQEPKRGSQPARRDKVLKKLIEDWKEAADALDIELDLQNLPFSKTTILGWLKKRDYKTRGVFSIAKSTFEDYWGDQKFCKLALGKKAHGFHEKKEKPFDDYFNTVKRG